MSTRLDFDVFARDRASKTFRDIGNDAHRSGGLVRGFGRSLAGAVAGGVIYQGVKEIAGGLVDMGKAAMDDQQAQVVLAQQLKNSAGATKEATSAVETWISRAGTAYGVVDDDLRPALGRLVAATGDVAQAQDLARLAMDVSAGTGKSLEAVTTALAKAQNGSIGGLSRLGVKTKDAEGNTRSLEDITKSLSKTFDGQAAKAANTAAGRYERLGVQFDETKEAIGARLIPIGLELSDWLLKDAVPAVSKAASGLQDEFGPAVNDLADSVRDVLPEIKDFAESFGKRVVPVLQETASATAKLVGFIDGLPGPVKSLGAEAAVAALILPRLSGAFDIAGAKVRELGDRTASTEGRMKMLGSAAKQAAGVGGVLLLAHGAKESNDALGVLETTAGGALTGFSVAGPWGAAIGAGAGALAGLNAAAGDVSAGMRALHEDADKARAGQLQLRDALDQTTGAMTAQARQTVSQDLFNARLANSMSTLGVSQQDMVSAILGQEGAYKRVNKAIQDNATVGGALATNQENALSDASAALAGYLDNAVPKFEATKAEIRAVAAGTGAWAKELKGLPKDAVTKVKAVGIEISSRQIAQLVRDYDLTPKQITTIVKATGGDASVAVVQRIVASMRAKAASDSPAVGRALGDGVVSGFSGTEDRLSGAARLAIRSAITAARAEAQIKSPSKKMHELGVNLGKGAEQGLDSWRKHLRVSGQNAAVATIDGLKDKIQSSRDSLKDALAGVADDVQSKMDEMNAAITARTDFAAGFQSFASSIFDAPTPDKGALTTNGLLDFATAQLAQAQQVQEAVNKLTTMGLSQSLIKQLQGKGASGFAQLIALSQGSQAQINTANSLDKQTTDTLTAAGLTAADATDIGSDAVTKTSAATLARLIGEQTAAALGKAETVTEVKIGETAVAAALKARNRKKGKK